jgi:hypothetical protein
MSVPIMMKAPHEKGVIQIDITNKCDLLKCSNCTRMLMHHDNRFVMSMENFRAAVHSLRDYPGVIGVFGGNPCVHPQFAEFSRVFAEMIPDKRRRGLWTNNFNGHGQIINEVYGYFNLNVHDNQKHADYMKQHTKSKVWGENRKSWHSPTLVAIRDVVPDEGKMWSMIEGCHVNIHWSGAITERNGQLRAYFCEIASSFDHMYNEDNGLPVTEGWWRQPISVYESQIKRWCPNCGIPTKMKGHLDLDFVDDVSKTHAQKVSLTLGGRRKVVYHEGIDQSEVHEVTDYMRIREKK